MPSLSELLSPPPLRWILAAFKLALLAGLLWFCAHVTWMLVYGLSDEYANPARRAQVAVVMGNEIIEGKPSPRLQARLDRALELYQSGRIEMLILSGGVEESGADEALIMGRYLLRKGVPREVMMVDSLGDNTLLTAANVKRMLANYQTRRALVVVSSYYHLLRARMLMQKCGFNVVYTTKSNYFEWRDLWYSIPKEFASYYYYLNQKCPESFSS